MGIRVLSVALNVPGPMAVARLVHEGVTACKVEPPSGDPLATLAPGWYAALHANVTRHRIDLKTDEGQARLDALLASSDVLLTSQRPSALARLRLSPEAVHERAAHLRSIAIVGDTARPEQPGHDVTYQAEAGLLEDRLPVTLVADLAGAERVVSALLLVLREPPGARRVVGLRDALEPFVAPRRHHLTRRGDTLGGGLPAYGVYPALDGHVAVAALEPHFCRRLYERLGLPPGAPLDDVFRSATVAHWTAFGHSHDVPIAAVAGDPPSPW